MVGNNSVRLRTGAEDESGRTGIGVQHAAAMVREDDEDVEHLEGESRDSEEVD